jgi:hypothetical protein
MGFFSNLYSGAKRTIGNVYDFAKNNIGKIAITGAALAAPFIAPKLYDMLPNEFRRSTGIRWDETIPVADKATAGRLYGSSYRLAP